MFEMELFNLVVEVHGESKSEDSDRVYKGRIKWKINETELLILSEFSLPFKKEGQDEWDGPGSQDGIGKTIDSWSWPYLFFVKQRLHWF